MLVYKTNISQQANVAHCLNCGFVYLFQCLARRAISKFDTCQYR